VLVGTRPNRSLVEEGEEGHHAVLEREQGEHAWVIVLPLRTRMYVELGRPRRSPATAATAATAAAHRVHWCRWRTGGTGGGGGGAAGRWRRRSGHAAERRRERLGGRLE
jgi:hypothetical protein